MAITFNPADFPEIGSVYDLINQTAGIVDDNITPFGYRLGIVTKVGTTTANNPGWSIPAPRGEAHFIFRDQHGSEWSNHWAIITSLAARDGILGLTQENLNVIVGTAVEEIVEAGSLAQLQIDTTAQAGIAGLNEQIEITEAAVINNIDAGIQGINDATLILAETLSQALLATIITINEENQRNADTIAESIETFATLLSETQETSNDRLEEILTLSTSDNAELLAEFELRIEDTFIRPVREAAESFIPLNEALLELVKKILDDPAGFIRESFKGTLAEGATVAFESASPFLEVLRELFGGATLQMLSEINVQESDVSDDAQTTINNIVKGIGTNTFTQSLIKILLTVVGSAGVIAAATVPARELFLRSISLDHPYLNLPVPDIINAMRRGFFSDDGAIDRIREHGLTNTDAGITLANAQTQLTPGDLIQLWFRSIIDDGQLEDRLRVLGYERRESAELMETSQFNPPVQDLIRMMVREVFSPIAETFGQFEDFPAAEMEEWGKKIGLRPEIAELYWAAHWQLPSLGMGYEMFHREVITREELEGLMKAQDVMPFWRDRLIEIAFRPLTRVDVRRMHKLGVLNEEDVAESYRTLGYSPENADFMTDFTVAFNQPKNALDDDEFKTFTRVQILNLWEDGIISQGDTQRLLREMDFSDSDVDLLITQQLIEIERTERKERINLIVAKFKAGIIRFDAAQDLLTSEGFESGEVDRARVKLVLVNENRLATPPVGDLKQLVTAGVISTQTFKEGLVALGYPERWVEAYTRLIEGKGSTLEN